MVVRSYGGTQMAKKRVSQGRDSKGADRAFISGVMDPRAFEDRGKSFADSQSAIRSEGVTEGVTEGIEDWEDQETAPDLFADASDEGQVQASGGHTQQLDEESAGKDRPDIRRR
jgi:hypothetical protein